MKHKLGGERVKIEGDPLLNARWEALTSFLEVLDDVTPYVLDNLRSTVLPRLRRFQELALDKSSDSKAHGKALRDWVSHQEKWLARYHLDSPHVDEAIWASAPFTGSKNPPFSRSPMTAILGCLAGRDRLYAEYTDRHGRLTESTPPRAQDVCSEGFEFRCSAFDPNRRSKTEWKREADDLYKKARDEHLRMMDTDAEQTPAIFNLDPFRWAALYLCGPREGDEFFGWSDREIALHETHLSGTGDKRLLLAATDKMKKGRRKILGLLEIQPRPSLPRGRPRKEIGEI